jgi:hypothetical protein
LGEAGQDDGHSKQEERESDDDAGTEARGEETPDDGHAKVPYEITGA